MSQTLLDESTKKDTLKFGSVTQKITVVVYSQIELFGRPQNAHVLWAIRNLLIKELEQNKANIGGGMSHLYRNIVVKEIFATENHRVAKIIIEAHTIPTFFVNRIIEYVLFVAKLIPKKTTVSWKINKATTR